ncbi:hypothetical protein BFF94_012230 [Burkholderia catarinensis]|nr:hypothetical protein BFF94_012230 [Burkholderia catarinensis]
MSLALAIQRITAARLFTSQTMLCAGDFGRCPLVTNAEVGQYLACLDHQRPFVAARPFTNSMTITVLWRT